MKRLVELCAGTASVSLWAMARCEPLTGFMGSKRRWAGALVDALDADRPDEVVLVDAGPWGDVWSVLRSAEARAETRAHLEALHRLDPDDRWGACLVPPVDDGPLRVARYLWLQARSAGTIPVWWSSEHGVWQSPTGARTEAAHERQARRGANQVGNVARRSKGAASALESSRKVGSANQRAVGRPMGRLLGPAYQVGARWARCRGMQHPATIARRIATLDRIDWSRVEVVQDRVEAVEPVRGARVFFDPPYANAPRYAVLLPRPAVLEVAQRWAGVAEVVAVAEREALPLDGWHPWRLADREWVTSSSPLRVAEQLRLPGVP